jgi:hypothetical protein
MPKTVNTPTRLGWNDARSLASQLLETEDSWGAILEETHLSVSQDELTATKRQLPEDGSDRVNELARVILDWQNTQHPAVNINELPKSVDGWNDAQRIASAMKTLIQSDSETTFGRLRDHISSPTPEFVDARSAWEEITTEDGGKALNEYARWALNWESVDGETDDAQQTTTVDETEEISPYEAFTPETRAEECANELLRTFKSHEEGYGDIFSEFNEEFDLPSLGRANVVVVNARGDTHEDRVQDIVYWLENELDESERAGNYRPSGME